MKIKQFIAAKQGLVLARNLCYLFLVVLALSHWQF